MINTVILYCILIVCAMVVFTPAVFAVIDRIVLNKYFKQLNKEHDTRVQCLTCHNYYSQSDMYFLDQCYNCYDIIVGDNNHG